MTDTANLFYRIDAGRFLAAVVQIPDAERGGWLLQLALDLVASDAEMAKSDFAKTVIAEADAYRGLKAKAGSIGGRARVRNVQAALKQSQAALKQNEAVLDFAQANQSVHLIKTSSSPDGDYSREFLAFWEAYPRKIGKGDAAKVFKDHRLGNGKLQTTLDAVDRYKNTEQWQRDGGKFIPNPATWLRQKRYDDYPEPAITRVSTPGGVVL